MATFLPQSESTLLFSPYRSKMATLPSAHPIHHEESSSHVLLFDPNSTFIFIWHRFMFLIVLCSVFVDGFFLYLPIVKGNTITTDFKAAAKIALIRMIGDSFYILGMIVKLRTAYEAPGSRVFRRRVLVKNPAKIFSRYLKSFFILDLIAALPLPQVYLWCNIPESKSTSESDDLLIDKLNIIIYVQMIPRMFFMLSLRRRIVETTGNITNHNWSGAVYFLLFYIVLSQYVGASYYSDYILQLLYCKSKLFLEDGNVNSIDADWSQLQAICDLKDKTERGIFSAFHANGIGSRSFFQRAMYCFSLGLKSLSSMGQNFETGYLASETLFSFLMSMCGLVLFAGLIAEMQTSIQSAQTGDEQPIVRLREIEKWTKIHQLPPELKARVRQTVSAELIATRNIDEKSILDLLPSELQCDIRRQFYRDLVRNLPFFENLDDQLLHSFCGFLRTASFSKGACLVAEGEPVRQIFFIYSGLLEGMVLDGGCSSLREGDLCGTELLSWVLKPSASTRNLPASAQTVMCLTNIDAFCILAEDLKLLSVQFNHDSKFQQALSCPSQQSIHSAVP